MKQITAVAFSTLVACVVASSALADASTPYDDLKFTTNDWYTAQASSLSTMGANGAWALGNTAVTSWTDKTNYVNGTVCIEVDTDSDEALTFTPSTSWSGDSKCIQMDFNVYAATVPFTVEPVDSAKVGFAIKYVGAEAPGTRSYIAFNGTSWITLSGTPVEEGVAYKLTIQIDNRIANGQLVRFLVNDTALTYNESEWIALNGSKQIGASPKLGFVGMGYFTKIEGDQLAITAEEVVIPGVGDVVIPEDIAASITVPPGGSFTNALVQTESNGNKVIDNIVLGLRDAEGSVTNLVASGSADAGSSDATKIKLGLNVNPPAGTGATITYGVYGSNSGAFGGEETLVGSTTTDPVELAIPLTGTKYKYYKVKATIAY